MISLRPTRAGLGLLVLLASACMPKSHVLDRGDPAQGPQQRDANVIEDAGRVARDADVTGPGLSTRSLHRVASYGVPVADAIGIACDGDYVWLSAGQHNGNVHEVIHIELATGVIDHRYSYTNLIEQLGTGVYGIEYDGTQLFLAVSGNTNKIVVIDAATGDIVREMLSPTELGPVDLELAGDVLYVAGGIGTIHRVAAATGAVLSSFALPYPERDHGFATIGSDTFIGDLFEHQLWIYDRTTGAPTGSITRIDDAPIRQGSVGLMCAQDDRLRVLSQGGIQEYEVR